MWKNENFSLPSVLIVPNKNGDVFIVEDQKNENQINKILSKDQKSRKSEIEIELLDPSRVELSPKIDQFSNHEPSFSKNQEEISPAFVDTTVMCEEDPPGADEDNSSERHVNEEHLDDDDYNKDVPSDTSIQQIITKKKPNTHKIRSLIGKPACKYCDTIFKSRERRKTHDCPFLRCDPNNFICRICNKELAKSTFSNHLHETSDCQYCRKNFMNPRNLKLHIEKQHKDEKELPAEKKSYDKYINCKLKEEGEQPEISNSKKKVKSKCKRKSIKLECDLCGKYLFSLRSMNFHLSLHTNKTCYICESCGTKFFTPNGIRNHSCEKKRRRPEVDFRTYDQRYCRFCDSRFANMDERKMHNCAYENPDDPKTVYCRFCDKLLNKLAFNRHIEIHSGVDWLCNICNRKLATERALKIHLTTHTGNKSYKCKLCTETFINRVVMDRHMRYHYLSTSNSYRCSHCAKHLSSVTSLKSHIQRVHNTSAQCELCKKLFQSKDELKLHISESHEPSICGYCNKSFALPRYLKMHEKLHNDDSSSKMQCQFCAKLLYVKCLRPHVYRAHPEQFSCWQEANPSLT